MKVPLDLVNPYTTAESHYPYSPKRLPQPATSNNSLATRLRRVFECRRTACEALRDRSERFFNGFLLVASERREGIASQRSRKREGTLVQHLVTALLASLHVPLHPPPPEIYLIPSACRSQDTCRCEHLHRIPGDGRDDEGRRAHASDIDICIKTIKNNALIATCLDHALLE